MGAMLRFHGSLWSWITPLGLLVLPQPIPSSVRTLGQEAEVYDSVVSIDVYKETGGVQFAGEIYLGPPVRTIHGFQGIAEGSLVRPLAYNLSYQYAPTGTRLGGSSRLQYLPEGVKKPEGASMTCRVGATPTEGVARSVNFRLTPKPELGWSGVRSEEDLQIDLWVGEPDPGFKSTPSTGKDPSKGD